jgi:RNA polymerase sigma-70 factor (ECF subfamily)
MERKAWLHTFCFALLVPPGHELETLEKELVARAGELGTEPLTLLAGSPNVEDLPGLADPALVLAVRKPLLAPEAFEVLYRRHLGPLVDGAFRRWGVDYQTGEDLAANLFLGLWAGKFAAYNAQRPFRPFLYRVAHNAAMTWHRQHRFLSLEEIAEPAGRGADVVFDEACLHEVEEAYARALPRLSPPQRDVLERALRGHGLPQIARDLGIPYHTAGVRLHAARQQLRRLL